MALSMLLSAAQQIEGTDLSNPPVKKERYAYYHPEGAGYLHLGSLSHGSEGVTSLVWSYADRKIYVRKRTKVVYIPWLMAGHVRGRGGQHASNEVQQYRVQKSIPRLVDWTHYRHRPRHHRMHHKSVSTSLIWQYCRGGDMFAFIRRYEILNSQVSPYHNALQHYQIPEAFIWKAMGQLVGAVNFLHQSRPGIYHHDFFEGNCFLDCPPGQDLPDVYLGDFGKSSLMNSTVWNARGEINPDRQDDAQPFMYDYESVLGVIKAMMVASSESGEPTESGMHKIWSTIDVRFAALEAACLGPHPCGYVPEWQSFRKTKEFPRALIEVDREEYQRQNDPAMKKYTPLLFDTIRNLERRIRIANGSEVDADYFGDPVTGEPNEAYRNRDWSYLAEAMQSKALERMPTTRTALDQATYPVVDDTFKKIVRQNHTVQSRFGYQIHPQTGEVVFFPDSFRSKTEVLLSDDVGKSVPLGPFKIAKLDLTDLANPVILGLSQRTYGTYDNPWYYPIVPSSWNPDMPSQRRNNNNHDERFMNPVDARSDSGSIGPDPTQTDGIEITTDLDLEVLRSRAGMSPLQADRNRNANGTENAGSDGDFSRVSPVGAVGAVGGDDDDDYGYAIRGRAGKHTSRKSKRPRRVDPWNSPLV